MSLKKKCPPIQLILSDVDGVLTNGGIYFDNKGIEIKRFHIRDGLGIRLWQRAGHEFGLVTGRSSHVVMTRSAELSISIVRQGVDDKLSVIREIAEDHQLDPENICFIGDDLPDMACVRWCGLGVAVSDAAPELREVADTTTKLPGGAGAVREVIETILQQQGRWDELVRRFI